jgi:hypothetical protein
LVSAFAGDEKARGLAQAVARGPKASSAAMISAARAMSQRLARRTPATATTVALPRILARRLTYLGGVTFSSEKIVGELIRQCAALTIPRKRLALLGRGTAQYGAGSAADARD